MTSNRGFRGRSTVPSQRRFTDLPEDVGNRQGFFEIRIPSDDVGNIIQNDPISTFIHDGLGNTVEGEPAHLKSGFIGAVGQRSQAPRRPYVQPKEVKPREIRIIKPVEPVRVNSDDLFTSLSEEFAKLIKNRLGMSFSFCMRPCVTVDPDLEQEHLENIQALLQDMLTSLPIEASIELLQYSTDAHRFAVFFIHPEEKDPVKNKDLISALRQVVNLYEKQMPPIEVNTMLVLSNAQTLIEDHLRKIGAKKIS